MVMLETVERLATRDWTPTTFWGTWVFTLSSVSGRNSSVDWGDTTEMSSVLQVGMIIKWTQNSTVKYGYITYVGVDVTLSYTEMIISGDIVLDTGTYPVSDIFVSTSENALGFTKGAFSYNTTIYTTGSGTYTVPAGVKKIYVEVQAGGGGGGGGAGTAASFCGPGGGGAGGGYTAKLITDLETSYDYVVGGGGGGGAAGNNNGTAGNTSSFGTDLLTVGGGSGGIGSANRNAAYVSDISTAGGISFAGDLSNGGGAGEPGICITGGIGMSGRGGESELGTGGKNRSSGTGGGNGNGGTGYGSGGAGGFASSGGANRGGGAGANGIIIIHEYY